MCTLEKHGSVFVLTPTVDNQQLRFKLTAEKAVEKGIIESAHNGEVETVQAAVSLGSELVNQKWDGRVYAQNRMTLYSDALATLLVDDTPDIGKHLSRL